MADATLRGRVPWAPASFDAEGSALGQPGYPLVERPAETAALFECFLAAL